MPNVWDVNNKIVDKTDTTGFYDEICICTTVKMAAYIEILYRGGAVLLLIPD